MKKTNRGFGRIATTLTLAFTFVAALAGCDVEEGAEQPLAEEVATEAEAHEGLATSDEAPVDSVGGGFSLEEGTPCGASSSPEGGCRVVLDPMPEQINIFKCCGSGGPGEGQSCTLTWKCIRGDEGVWRCQQPSTSTSTPTFDTSTPTASGKSCRDDNLIVPDGEGGSFLLFYQCCEGGECTVTTLCHLRADGESTCYNYSPT